MLEFSRSHLSSVAELAVLIALIEAPSRWWDARAVARHVGIERRQAARILDLLAARNLLDIRVTEHVRYQYRPARPEVANAAGALARAYRRNPAAVESAVIAQGS